MKDYKTTRFKRRIRIAEDSLEYIRRVKGKYTSAGMLDKIINEYRNANKQGAQAVSKAHEAKTSAY